MAEKKAGRDGKVLGYDSETGLAVTLRTVRFGPYVQLGEGTNEEKPKRTDIPRGVNANTIELQYALKLLSLPREVGLHPETGKPVTAGLNYFRHNGPFIEHAGTYVDLPGVEEVFEIGINRAVAALAEKGKRLGAAPAVLMNLGEHPEQGGKVQVLSGRHGPYVKHGNTNATLPRGHDPATITLEEAVSLIADTPGPGARREGEMVQKFRENAGLTADELGKRVGASSMTVRQWEDGKLLSIKDVEKIARALGCSPEYILGFDVKQDPDETTEEQNIAVSTWSWTWHILGMLLGTATAISIIKNGFAIDLYGLPAKVLAQYHWLRDTLLVPVVWAVRYFGIEITWWVKDTVMAYALIAAAHARAYQLLTHKRLVDPDWSLYLDILLWPKLSWRVLRDLFEARGDREYFNRYGFERLYSLRTSVDGADYAIAFATRQLRYISLQLVLISVATMAFFVWNHLSGVYGPT